MWKMYIFQQNKDFVLNEVDVHVDILLIIWGFMPFPFWLQYH
jgi:hypothetical protein